MKSWPQEIDAQVLEQNAGVTKTQILTDIADTNREIDDLQDRIDHLNKRIDFLEAGIVERKNFTKFLAKLMEAKKNAE